MKPFNVFSDLSAARANEKQIRVAGPRLLELFRTHDDPVGAILLGQSEREWIPEDLQRLVRTIHDEISDIDLRYDVLRLLRKTCQHWASVQRSSVHLPPIPIPRRAPKNPSRLSLATCRIRYDSWKEILSALIGLVAGDPDVHRFGIAVVLISSVLFSGLLDLNYLVAIVRAFANFERTTMLAGGRLHIELEVARRGNPRGQFLRLKPDLLTSVLWMVTPPDAVDELLRPGHDGTPVSDKELKVRIRELFASVARSARGKEPGKTICGLMSLIEAVEVIAHTEMPGYVVHIANGVNACSSIPRQDFERMFDGNIQYLRVSGPAEIEDSVFADERKATLRYVSDELVAIGEAELSQLFADDLRASVRAGLVARSRSKKDFIARLCDFGDYLLAVRTAKNKMRSVDTVRSIVVSLYRCSHWYFGDEDPAGLPADDLEDAYRDIVAGIPAEERIQAARLLRLNHTYLHAQGKPWLAADSVLRRYWPTSSVDAGVIFEEDYEAILQDADRKWRTDQRRSEMAKVIVDCLRYGMRRQEARQRVIDDVFVDFNHMPLEVLVRKTRDGLKTLASKRRVPVEHLPNEGSRQRLSEWTLRRKAEPGTTGKDFLFEEDGELVTDYLTDELNEIFRARTGHHAHSSRHAIVSFGILGATLGDMFGHRDFDENFPGRGDIPVVFPYKQKTDRYVKQWSPAIRAVHGHNEETGKHVHMIARILGHSPKTLMAVYFNLPGTILRICLDYSQTMRPEDDLVRNASLRKRTTLNDWTADRGVADIPVRLFKARARTLGPPITPTETRAITAPAISSEDRCSPLYDFLMELSQRSPEEIARRNNLPIAEAELRYQRSAYLRDLGSGPGYRTRVEEVATEDGGTRRLACPLRPIHEADLVVVDSLMPRIQELVNSPEHSELTKRALSTFVHRIWHERNWVVFHSIDEAEEAKALLKWLRLCLLKKDIRFCSFSQKQRSQARKAWRDELLTDKDEIEDITPPNRESEATEWWFGIAPTFATDDSGERTFDGSAGFRYVMTMAYILFGDGAENQEQ